MPCFPDIHAALGTNAVGADDVDGALDGMLEEKTLIVGDMEGFELGTNEGSSELIEGGSLGTKDGDTEGASELIEGEPLGTEDGDAEEIIVGFVGGGLVGGIIVGGGLVGGVIVGGGLVGGAVVGGGLIPSG